MVGCVAGVGRLDATFVLGAASPPLFHRLEVRSRDFDAFAYRHEGDAPRRRATRARRACTPIRARCERGQLADAFLFCAVLCVSLGTYPLAARSRCQTARPTPPSSQSHRP